ncbi:CmpA/NrtA family ABC transporter substrate-binding protein [Pelagibacterium lentulum]|uniref:Nitrate transporter n=1 Tax=Pelagibacterium lentulum TaxID=2029865 RepID=A0A916R7X6_9HYPH|nr:CmpA/NrtA family ABC transporter substrate-binding protein [Pelagibacterium lentulum]GGA35067.1 nitrate transporter [Pelagibacterium lentulum]
MTATHLTAGFMPLLDAVLLVVAHEKGFAHNEGLALHLVKENSWANIRDRAALGHFDVAQMLAPMPIAASLGLTPLSVPMIAPFVLGLGNNGITVSADLWRQMRDQGAPDTIDPASHGEAFRKVVEASPRKLRFGVVHQTSSHNYELRYWMAASGVRPDRDVEIVVLPPQYLPGALGAGGVDGYCVGEPWNSVGVAGKSGRLLTVKDKIWSMSPDKVVGMRADWAEENPDTVSALIRALYRAGLWASEQAHFDEMAAIMAQPHYLNAPREIVIRALTGRFVLGHGAEAEIDSHFVPSAHNANFPWKSQALWYYSQMVRWGEAPQSPTNADIAAACFRADLYRAALTSLGVNLPEADYKSDDGFFDDVPFDPQKLEAYISSQAD